MKSRIKAVLLTNPSNPLGRCYPRNVLIECLEFCQERGLHLISDELYALTDLGHVKKSEEFVSVLSLTDPFLPEGAIKVEPNRVHVIWSASKLFGLSGLRVVSPILQFIGARLTFIGLSHLATQPRAHQSYGTTDSDACEHHIYALPFVTALIVTSTDPAGAQLGEIKGVLPSTCRLPTKVEYQVRGADTWALCVC